MFIRTVTGDILPEVLGFTHCHEHLFTGRIEGVELEERILLDSFRKSRREARAFHRCGGRGIVDAQPFGAGRDAARLKRISEQTGVHIVSSTGFHKTFFYPREFWAETADVDEISALFVSEIEEGMYEYNEVDPFKERGSVRAGIIKIATAEQGLTPLYEKIFSAAAKAHGITGAPIMTHTELSTFGYEQIVLLNEKGVGSEHIIVSHMDRVIDVESNVRLARMGVFLEYDTIARYKYHSDEDELMLIGEMVKQGFGEQVLLGLDTTRERMKAYGGSMGLDYIAVTFIPMLADAGIGENHAEDFMVHNPRRALSFVQKGIEQ